MIKLIHTADWHLGKRLMEQSLLPEQSKFLGWLGDFIEVNQTNYLLMSGDLFDVSNPPQEAVRLFYDFLKRLYTLNCTPIITGGNHDSVAVLSSPQTLLEAFNMHLIPEANPKNPATELVELQNSSGEITAILAATPYLREKDLITNAEETDAETRLIEGHRKHFHQLADLMNEKYPGVLQLGMGHLYVSGSETSDTERSVGTLNGLPFSIFPDSFAYLALGHIHKAQGFQKNRIVYAGSPVKMSFSEINYRKRIVLLDVEKNAVSFSDVEIPSFREVQVLSGTLEACFAQASTYNNKCELPAFLMLDIQEELYEEQKLVDLNRFIVSHNTTSESSIIIDRRIQFAQQTNQTTVSTPTLKEISPNWIFDQFFSESTHQDYEALKSKFDACVKEVEGGAA